MRVPERGQPGDDLVVHGLAVAAQVLDDGVEVAGVPPHDGVEDQAERGELVFLAFAVGLPDLAAVAVADLPTTQLTFTMPCSAAARRARASMSGSGSTPATARTRPAIGKASWPVPQPRSTTTSILVSLNAFTTSSMTADG